MAARVCQDPSLAACLPISREGQWPGIVFGSHTGLHKALPWEVPPVVDPLAVVTRHGDRADVLVVVLRADESEQSWIVHEEVKPFAPGLLAPTLQCVPADVVIEQVAKTAIDAEVPDVQVVAFRCPTDVGGVDVSAPTPSSHIWADSDPVCCPDERILH